MMTIILTSVAIVAAVIVKAVNVNNKMTA